MTRRRVSVCGDSAAHPLLAPLLVGLGCDSLSVSSAALGEVRALVRALRHDEYAVLAADALALGNAQEVHALVRTRCGAALHRPVRRGGAGGAK
jgi:phosphocarrier protein FPr